MKLIILHYQSDGYTDSEHVIPVERDSVESLMIELKEWAQQNSRNIYGWENTGIDAQTILGESGYCSIEILPFNKWWDYNVKWESDLI